MSRWSPESYNGGTRRHRAQQSDGRVASHESPACRAASPSGDDPKLLEGAVRMVIAGCHKVPEFFVLEVVVARRKVEHLAQRLFGFVVGGEEAVMTGRDRGQRLEDGRRCNHRRRSEQSAQLEEVAAVYSTKLAVLILPTTEPPHLGVSLLPPSIVPFYWSPCV